jgi:hypothetical protein
MGFAGAQDGCIGPGFRYKRDLLGNLSPHLKVKIVPWRGQGPYKVKKSAVPLCPWITA